MRDTKMIRVVSRGFVTTSRGRVIAPIMSPYRESISRIWSMITVDRADVEEKLPDGTFVKLNAQNFDKENFVSKERKVVPKPEVKNVDTPVETFKNTDGKEITPEEKAPVVPEVKEEVVEPKAVDTPVEEEVSETKDIPESDSKDTQNATITVNGQKRVDPRFNNKKNRGKNRNNNQNGNNQSVAVDAEPVE